MRVGIIGLFFVLYIFFSLGGNDTRVAVSNIYENSSTIDSAGVVRMYSVPGDDDMTGLLITELD